MLELARLLYYSFSWLDIKAFVIYKSWIKSIILTIMQYL